jgi:SAM-dependent methyltransferase
VSKNVSDTPASFPYLDPYLKAAERHGAGFASLLWASPETQATRFDAIERLGRLHGKSVLDVGCGRADLLTYLLGRGVRPADYTGIEAVSELASAAERSCAGAAGRGGAPPARIIRADFLREPLRLFVGADVVVFSGSLNTVDDGPFYDTIRRAFEATADVVVFNFLCSPYLAGADYLRWRRPSDVLRFCSQLTGDVRTLDDYLQGDSTVALRAAPQH